MIASEIRRIAIDLDLLAEEMSLLDEGKADPQELSRLTIEVDLLLHPFTQRVAAISLEAGPRRAIEVASELMSCDIHQSEKENPLRQQEAEHVREALERLSRLPVRPVLRVLLATGEVLWGRITELDADLVTVDTGRGIRVFDADLVSKLMLEDVSEGPE